MSKAKEREVLSLKRFKSKNGVPLKCTQFISLEGYSKGRENWLIERTDRKEDSFVDSVNNGIGKFYSFTFKEMQSVNQLIDAYKDTYILKHLHLSYAGYTVNLYKGKELSRPVFNEMMKEIIFLLHEGKTVSYNDEHGVGDITLDATNKKKPYKAKHCRYGTVRYENLTQEGIADFLREFFDIGYHYDRINDWEN